MVLKAHDLLSDASVIRSQNQNGSCSSNGASALPLKWKPRNISAVRDFPRGCGPIVQPVHVGSQEASSSSSLPNNNSGANDVDTVVKQVDSLSHDVPKSTEDVNTGLIVDLQKDKGDNQDISKDEISGPINAAIEVDDTGGSFIKESTRKMKFPHRRVSAVREFPPYCGLNATEPSKEERLRINGKRRSAIDDIASDRNARLIDSTVAGCEESNDSVKDDLSHKTQSNESNESLMANQDPVADKDDQRSHNASQIIKKVCQDLVVYTRDNNVKKRSLVNASDEDSEENREDESFHVSETESVLPIRSLPPSQENNKKVNSQSNKVSRKKKRPFEVTNNHGFVKGERSLVLGLKASSLCPAVIPSITPKKSKLENVKADKESSTYTGTLDVAVAPKKSKLKKFKADKELSTDTSTPDMAPKKSKSKKVKADKELNTDTSTSDVAPKKSKSEKVKADKESSTDTSTPDVAKKSKSKKVKADKELNTDTSTPAPKKSKSEKVKADKESNTDTSTPDVAPKKSKSKKVKADKESNTNTSTPDVAPKKSKSKKVKDEKKISVYTGTLDVVVRDEELIASETEEQEDEIPNSHEVDVALPPFGPQNSDSARNRVRKTLRLFQALYRKLLQGEESKTSQNDESKPIKRVDLAARAILQERGKAHDRGKKTHGSIPGVEVGDEFQYRVELALVGLHWPFQGGIDYIKQGKSKKPVAVSVVASGGYDNELNKPECLIYSGSGGIGKDKQVEDQKLERGNIALKNNIDLKIPVRVIRGYKGKSTEPSSKSLITTYIYDGLYMVEKYWQEKGPHGNLVFKFELKRIPGQPELALREVKSKKFKAREGLCVPDITSGKETIRIPAINTIDNEKPPPFHYITKLVYPDSHRRGVPPAGCDCVGRCSDKRCKCAAKNGGGIPYNHNGAIVEAKPLVYECGPACKCPPSCYNRVSQHGMKIQLEIFKTESRGWGVRSLNSISSGSFICEYVGELLEDTEAEKRTGNDEYLFDIGQNYSDTGMDMNTGVDTGTGGFTIDAANYGNVGRFINHSCSPNLYAQNVLYDEEDKRMPHIMLFAAENISPLQELTYHYNYAVDTVHDSDGNIKVKKCFCGSPECTGRLY